MSEREYTYKCSCGKTLLVGDKCHENLIAQSPAPICYAAFLMHVETGHGGHISVAGTGKSLCGVERRFPSVEREQDFSGDNFAEWIKDNEPFVCRNCLRIWRRNDDSATAVR